MITSSRFYERSYDNSDNSDVELFLGITPVISQAMSLARSIPGCSGSITGVFAEYVRVPGDEQIAERTVNQLQTTISAPVLGGVTSMLMNKCNLGSIFPDGASVAFDNGGGRGIPRMYMISANPDLRFPPYVEAPFVLVELIGDVVKVSGYTFEDVWVAMSEDEIRDTMSLRSLSLIASAILEFAKKALSPPGQN